MADNESTAVEDDGGVAVVDAPESPKMELEVEVTEVGPCRKHVRVVIPRAEIEDALNDAVDELAGQASVPGFRAGKVPPALVRKKFKSEIEDQVKQNLLLQSLEQVSEENELDPINEPDLDVEALEIPEEGDFEYEFDVEVRPEFALPQYKGLKIERPVAEVSDDDVDAYMAQYLEQYSTLEDADGAIESGQSITISGEFTSGDKQVSKFENLRVRVRPTLRFADGEVSDFEKLVTGKAAGDSVETGVSVSMEAQRVEMRGESLTLKATIGGISSVVPPVLDAEFLERVGVESEAELRDLMYSNLERQSTYGERQKTREQVLEKIGESATWDLPEELVEKQTDNAMRREVLEMQQAGFTSDQIRARENDLRQRAISMTRQNLKEHFVLDRVAEEEGIEVTNSELETEIAMMALQAGENPRRVRARLIKTGVIENLRAQIRERKAVDVILGAADFVDVEGEPVVEASVEAVSRLICPPVGTAPAIEDEASDDDE